MVPKRKQNPSLMTGMRLIGRLSVIIALGALGIIKMTIRAARTVSAVISPLWA
jgi:hypothetical protein